MAVERAPYINYTEITSYLEDIDNGSEIPLFLVKTNNTVNLSDITADKVLRFISYGSFKNYFSISENESSYNLLDDSIKEIDVLVKRFFMENSMYGDNDNYGLSVPYIYLIDVGNKPTVEHYKKALSVSETKRKSTVIFLPHTEDVEFMKEVAMKLKQETKHGLLRIAYFGVSGQGELNQKFAKGNIIIPTFDHHGYTNIVQGYKLSITDDENSNIVFSESETYADSKIISPNKNLVYQDLTDDKYYIYSDNTYKETTLESLEGYKKVIEGYKEENIFYEDSGKSIKLTPDMKNIYLNKNSDSNADAYTYDGDSFIKINALFKNNIILYESDENYKFFIPSTKKEFGGTDETFDEYCERLQFISQEVQSSRVAIVDKKRCGEIIARISSTPYYIEPGYLPFMSISTGVFNELTEDERDTLFATGLIFGEDDSTLSITTPRICVATSTAWGIENHDMRPTDSLIHARRNVDHQIKKILQIIAPQLKRNETSVTLRHIKNQVDLYLDSELSKGTIMEYSIDVIESSYNPYKLLVKGRIVPVNSTLAIEFENTVGSPYAIASDYV